ncbi:MAG TPA: phenylalanine--tRNA ligase subunit beta [Propionicimonas sp.]|nr:phenylalanine--tRNA ligase subunit beta [Propionicimonas sp.]
MRAPLTWLAEHVDLPEGMTGRELSEVLIRAGLEVETVDEVGAEVRGPIVVGRILAFTEEPQKNGKTIRWVQVDVGAEHNQPHEDFPQGCRSVVCGADNFAVDDLVVVSLPGTTLPGGFEIAARKTYGHVSDGMICAEDELGIGSDHSGIIVLPRFAEDGSELQPGDDPADYLVLRDDVLDIDVSPDIGYCLSIRGLAREAGQNLGVSFTDVVNLETPRPVADGHPVILEDPACPLFVALTVTGIDKDRPTPRWMARRLVMAGMRSISLAVDITNYAMLETGQPLHAYDASLLTGPIRVRKATAGETLVTLDDQTRTLDVDDLLITDDTGPIGLAGVMGGQSTEIGEHTVDVVIEAANFDSRTISRTLRRHNLPSEASKRFHRGVDPDAAYSAAHLAARLLVELAGGTLSPKETVAGAVPALPTVLLPASLPSEVLGVQVAPERVVEVLRASGCRVVAGSEELAITPPTWRPDLRDPYEFAEEVGRKVGFDKIPSLLPVAPPGRGLTRSQRARRAVAKAAVDAGFVEVLTFPFMASDDLDRQVIPPQDSRRRAVRLANPLAETAPLMRTSMLPGLFGAVARNNSRGNDDLALFEVGSVFLAGADVAAPLVPVDRRPLEAEMKAINAALPDQPRHLGAVLTGQWVRAGWDGPGVRAGWRQAFALAELVAAAVGAGVERRTAHHAPWHPGRCAELLVEGVSIGFAGELHPAVIADYGLPSGAAAVEIDLDALIAAAPVGGSIRAVSGHPVAKEDVALIVPDSVSAAEVQAALVHGAGELLESISLFDVFTGEQVPSGHRSLAFALRFRALDRTLTDAETAQAREAAVATAANLGAVLRSF